MNEVIYGKYYLIQKVRCHNYILHHRNMQNDL